MSRHPGRAESAMPVRPWNLGVRGGFFAES
jgi:hypothetical protein